MALTGHAAESEDDRQPDGGRPMTLLSTTVDETVTATTHAGAPTCPRGRPWRHRQPEPRDGLAGHQEDAPQPGAVLRRHDPAAAVHGDVRLHLRRRDLRQRRGLPADHHPRHPRPDRADRVHGDRHPAPRGHGQGRLRPVQVAADRADRPAGRPGDRGPAPLRHRGHAHDPHRHRDGLPAGRRRRRRLRRLVADDHRRLVAGLDLHLPRHDGPQRPGRPGHLDDDHVPADVPVERVRPGRDPAGLARRRS